MIYRGNIIEVKKDSLVVMLDDCTFKRVKRFKGLDEGMEIYFEERDIIKQSNPNLKSIALIAASIFIFIVTTFYGVDVWNTNYKAVALVSVDINPSVEIKLNKNKNVISAVALNEDAKKLALKNLKSKPINEALGILVDMARVEGYIKEQEENYILVTSVDLTEGLQEENLLMDLITVGKEKIESSAIEVGEQVEVITIKSDKITLNEAKKENISVGKKELNKDADIKQEDNLREKIKLNKAKDDKKLKELEEQLKKEAKELEQKLKEVQKFNKTENPSINNNGKNNEAIKEDKDKLKEELKNNKDIEKQLKEQQKNNEKDLKEQQKNDGKDLKNQEKEIKNQEKNKAKEVKQEEKSTTNKSQNSKKK